GANILLRDHSNKTAIDHLVYRSYGDRKKRRQPERLQVARLLFARLAELKRDHLLHSSPPPSSQRDENWYDVKMLIRALRASDIEMLAVLSDFEEFREELEAFELLSVEVLRNILFHLHPNELPTLAAVNLHLRNILTGCIDLALAKYHLDAHPYSPNAEEAYESVEKILQAIHFDHPLLFEHNVAIVARHGEIWRSETWVMGRFKCDFDTRGDWEMIEGLRLRRVEAVKTALDRGSWPSQQQLELWGFMILLTDLLLEDLRQRFPDIIKADLNTYPYRSFIYASARAGFEEGLELIPNNHRIVREPESRIFTWKLLELAIQSRNPESADLLLVRRGAPVNEDVSISPLHCMVDNRLKHADFNEKVPLNALDYLIEYDADIEALNPDGHTVLHIAAEYGRTDWVQTLLNAGADIDAADWDGFTPLGLAAKRNRTEVMKILRKHGARVRKTEPLTLPRLYEAIELNDCHLLRFALSVGDDIDGPRGLAANALLEAGAKPNTLCWRKRTALHAWAEGLASGIEAEALLGLLLEHEIDLNAQDQKGMTELHVAASVASPEKILMLLRTEDIELGVMDENGDTWEAVARSVGMDDWMQNHAEELEALGAELDP
ncbi:hypothetical protein HDU96_010179, partial [Phlyctochytrium bullatum]